MPEIVQVTSRNLASLGIIHKLVQCSSTALPQLSCLAGRGGLNNIHTQHLVAGTTNVMSFSQNIATILLYV